MKVICDRSALLTAINTVSKAVATRTPRIQLTCVKLSATKTGKGGAGELTLSATDAEISLQYVVSSVEVQAAGDALIPADKLRQIISAEDGEPTLTLELEAEACWIRGADAKFKLNGFPASDFPPIPAYNDILSGTAGVKVRTHFSISAGTLHMLADRTLFATARENSRYAINGVFMKRDGKKLEMVATDGRRLALCRGAIPGGKDDKPASCIIPTKALNVLKDLVKDAEENVLVAMTDTQIFFAFSGIGEGGDKQPIRATLASNLVEGTFPPYEDVIPKDNDKRVTFDRDLVKSAVGRAALLTNEESRAVKMKFSASGKNLQLSSRATEMGEADIKIDISKYEGEDIEIGFNPLFLVDALKVIPETEVILEMKSPNKPGLVKAGTEFLYVIMPLNLQ